MATCDKCGKEVDPTNSALKLQELVLGPFTAGFVSDRHLYPTGDCPGSPSRVVMIGNDPEWASAYRQMQGLK